MNKIKLKNLIECFCPVLILSYFFIHNIFLVFIGIFISLYILNITYIEKYINKNFINKNKTKSSKINNIIITPIVNNKDLNKSDVEPSLVEIIEELGFIPSMDKTEKHNTA